MIIHVTGHRPKSKSAYSLRHPMNIAIGKKMREFIFEQAGYNNKTNSFSYEGEITLVSGMALGIDTIWALVALKLKKEFPGKFKLECAIPCINHGENWSSESIHTYKEILRQADVVTYVSKEKYQPWLMQKRNMYMVDKSDITFAVWDGSRGGTGNCVAYAIKKKKPIYVLHPLKLTLTKINP